MHVVNGFLGPEGCAVVDKNNLIAVQALQAAKFFAFHGGVIVDEAHLVYGREKRRDLAAGQHLLPAEWVCDVTDAWASHRLAVFGDRNQLDASELDVRGEEECMLVPSELPDRWLPAAGRRESIVAAWQDVREQRLHAEKLAWPVDMQVYPKGACVW